MSAARWEVVFTYRRRPWWGFGFVVLVEENAMTSPPGTTHAEALRVRDEFLACRGVLSASVREAS